MLKTVDCKYGDWVWDECSISCGEGGFQIGTRPILLEASGEGHPCNETTVDGRSCGDPCTSGKQEAYFCNQQNIPLYIFYSLKKQLIAYMGHGYGVHVQSHVATAPKLGTVRLSLSPWGKGNPATGPLCQIKRASPVFFAQVCICYTFSPLKSGTQMKEPVCCKPFKVS